jgi:hypothetical protein
LQPLTIDHEILTKDGWKAYTDIKRVSLGQDVKPVGENDTLVSLDINDLSIISEQFVGELYLSKSNKVMYNIKNYNIDTLILEDTKLPYKLNLNENIQINTLVKIIYDMNKNNLDKFYLITNSNNISFIEINKNDLIRNILETDVFSFITIKNTFYVRRNNLEFWTSY